MGLLQNYMGAATPFPQRHPVLDTGSMYDSIQSQLELPFSN